MRVGADTGNFFHKPDENLIDKMEGLLTGMVPV
jgi:hypothetical protein